MLVVAAWRPEEIGGRPRRRCGGSAGRVHPARARSHATDVAELADGGRPRPRAPSVLRRDRGPAAVRGRVSGGRSEARPRMATLPGGVRELLDARLDGIGEAATQLLAAAAVIGRSFDVDTLRAAAGRGEDETVDRPRGADPARADRRARVGATTSRTTSCSAGRYERASLARRRLLHRRVADGAGRPAGRPGAGRPPPAGGRSSSAEAAEAFRAAGDRARALHATSEALEAYRSAIALGHAERGDCWTRRSATCTRCAASTASADLGVRGGGGARRAGAAGRRSSTSWAVCTTGAAIPSSPSAISLEALRLGGESARVQADRSLVGAPAGPGRGRGRARPPVAGAGRGGRRRRGRRPGGEHPGDADGRPRPPGAQRRAGRVAPRPQRARRRAQQPRAGVRPRGRADAGDRADRPGARALLRAGRPPPRGGAAQQPGRPAAPRRAARPSRWST